MPTPAADAPLPPADAAVPAPRNRACVVTLGGRPFAVDVREVREVVMLEPLTAMPGAPAPLLGVANLEELGPAHVTQLRRLGPIDR